MVAHGMEMLKNGNSWRNTFSSLNTGQFPEAKHKTTKYRESSKINRRVKQILEERKQKTQKKHKN